MVVKEYRKKPIVVEAFQVTALDSSTVNQIAGWVSNPSVEVGIYSKSGKSTDYFPYLGGDSAADHISIISRDDWSVILNIFVGDYVVKGIDGSVYPVKEETFKKTYEEVTSEGNSEFFSKAIVW